jgi:succinate dehydrogenase / fumarate reductase cytochrome b subunit
MPVSRPVYLDLHRMHLPLTGWVSILHRLSGALLFLLLPLGVWALDISLRSEAAFGELAALLGQPWGKLFSIMLFWAFIHHVLAGLRHLVMDAHLGVDLKTARATALAVFIASAVLSLALALRLFL